MSDSARWTHLALAAFVVVLWFATLSSRPLFNPDEGRYAEIPREMLAGGDWLVPHLDGLTYIEKPPLQYWATAVSLRLFGLNEFGARFYTALCALGTVVVVWVLGRGVWGEAVAWRAAFVLASLLLFVVLGQLLTLDMSLTFYMTLALAGFMRGAGVERGWGWWMLVAWAAVGLGVLTKGPIAAVVPAAVLVLYTLATRDAAPWRRLRPGWGVPLFLAITVPWHWAAARRVPDFLEFFFVHEHVSRFLTPSADREEPWWFFVAVLALGCIPWTVSMVRVLVTTRRRAGGFDATVFLWIWVLFVAVFFSLSDSKLIPYVLPALPALALLIGALPAQALRRDVTLTAVLTVGAAVVLGAVTLAAPRWVEPSDRSGYFLMLARPLQEIAAVLGVSGLFVLLRCGRDVTRAALFLSVGWCLSGMLLTRAASVVAPVYSGVVLSRALAQIPSDVPVYSVGTYDQTLPFYGRRTVTLVAYRGELDFGLNANPQAELPSVADFVAQWQDLSVGVAVMERTMFDDLDKRHVPMRELARDVHRVLVARR